MARLDFGEHGLAVELSTWEKLGGLSGDLSIDYGDVLEAVAVDDLWEELRGIRAPGTGIPGKVMLGTTRYDGGKDFNAVYGRQSGVVISLRDNAFRRVLVSIDRADADAAVLELRRRLSD